MNNGEKSTAITMLEGEERRVSRPEYGVAAAEAAAFEQVLEDQV